MCAPGYIAMLLLIALQLMLGWQLHKSVGRANHLEAICDWLMHRIEQLEEHTGVFKKERAPIDHGGNWT